MRSEVFFGVGLKTVNINRETRFQVHLYSIRIFTFVIFILKYFGSFVAFKTFTSNEKLLKLAVYNCLYRLCDISFDIISVDGVDRTIDLFTHDSSVRLHMCIMII